MGIGKQRHVVVTVPGNVIELPGIGQAANLVQIEPQAPMIALSLNASALYFGFAVGGVLGGIVLTALTPSDLGWVGGSSVATALALVLLRGWQLRLKTA